VAAAGGGESDGDEDGRLASAAAASRHSIEDVMDIVRSSSEFPAGAAAADGTPTTKPPKPTATKARHGSFIGRRGSDASTRPLDATAAAKLEALAEMDGQAAQESLKERRDALAKAKAGTPLGLTASDDLPSPDLPPPPPRQEPGKRTHRL